MTPDQATRTTDPAEATTVGLRRPRLVGIDVARGIALLGMLAVHTLPAFADGDPTPATTVAAGRSAATFVLVAGIGLTIISGGRTPARGVDRIGVSAGLVVRATLIGSLGLIVGLLSDGSGVIGILPYYGLFFLLAIPLLGLTTRVLAIIAAVAAVVGPVLLKATADVDWPAPDLDGDPVPGTLLDDPTGLLTLLSVTGGYPVVVYLAYLCAGIAIGRLDLRSGRVAWWLLGSGAALAVAARSVSAVLLYPLGGLAKLAGDSAIDGSQLLWEAEPSSSWWYLALPAPHSHSIVDVVHTLGSAIAVVGAAVLVTRSPAVARLLQPLAAAGSMALTLYAAHLVVLATGVLDNAPELLFLIMVVAALSFAWWWRRRYGRGPLERVVTTAAGSARRAAVTMVRRRSRRRRTW